MLPSRSTLQSWVPDSLSTSGDAVDSSGSTVGATVSGLDDAINRLPEVEGWSGAAHDAATGMFGRADLQAQQFTDYAKAVATALKNGAGAIGAARAALLAKADLVDAGPLNVTDQWVVLIDPVRMSADDIAELQALAATEQTSINTMLVAVGDADESTANAVVAAGKKYGFVEPREPTDFGELMISANKRPPDQVPNPHDPVGMLAQQAIRNGDQMITVREVVESTNAAGEEVTTVVMQDGSRHVMTRVDPFEFPSRTDFYEIEHFDKDGEWLSRTSSWHELGNDYKYTSVTWPDGSNYTITMDSTGYRRAGFTTPSGGHHSVPVELIDNISLTSNSLMSGLEKHIERGGSLPMLTQESVEKLGSATKFGGPALSIGTTVFDMIMAESGRDACIAAVAGATGAGGGWGGVKLGVYLGGITGSPYAIPPLVILLGAGGAFGAGKIGKFVGDVVCPY